MMKNKRGLILLLLALVCVWALSGCSSAPDSVEDPLSQFGVDAQLPFQTAAPEAVATPTPEPTVAPTPTATPDWRDDTSGVSGSDEGEYQQLRAGDSGDAVKRLQERLKELDYFTGTPDGAYGSTTVSAVRKFQTRLGLDSTGIASATLQRLLFSSMAPAYSENDYDFPDDSGADDTGSEDDDHTSTGTGGSSSSGSGSTEPSSAQYVQLSRGDSGTRVRQLQQRLKTLNYYSGTVDGVYGSGTEAAVKLFEKVYGKTQTGVATVSLQKKLYATDALRYQPEEDEEEPEEAEYVTLSPGDTGERVKRLQRRLKDLGYFDGEVAGNYLSKTTEAVKLFQKQLGLSQTGVATVALQRRLFASNAPAYSNDDEGYVRLGRGDTGAAVSALQKRLKQLGYYTGSVDGTYGTGTVNAVKRFEAAYGKAQTGVATVALQKVLYSEDAKPYNQPSPTPVPQPTVEPDEYVKLSAGSTGVRVMTLQNRLLELGYFNGEVDGIYGSDTVAAVKRFEKAYNRSQTGIATVSLQKVLFSANAKPYEGELPSVTPSPTPETDGEYVTLSPGDTGERVKKLQRRLKELGYFDGDIGGNYLTKTTAAVKLFEKAYGKTQTGIASVALQKVLFSDGAKPYKNTSENESETEEDYVKLAPGATGERVKKLQRRLKELGYFDGEIGGNYQTKTTAAVKRFQKALGLSQTGIASISLQRRLFADDAPYYGQESDDEFEDDGEYETLQQGDSGSAVTRLQQRLNELGYQPDIPELGTFDRYTASAVLEAQIAWEGEGDGVADARFQRFIYSDEAWTIALSERG